MQEVPKLFVNKHISWHQEVYQNVTSWFLLPNTTHQYYTVLEESITLEFFGKDWFKMFSPTTLRTKITEILHSAWS